MIFNRYFLNKFNLNKKFSRIKFYKKLILLKINDFIKFYI